MCGNIELNKVRNPTIKIWAWQRLWKINGEQEVHSCLAFYEDSPWLHTDPNIIDEDGRWIWLCPKPNLVLI